MLNLAGVSQYSQKSNDRKLEPSPRMTIASLGPAAAKTLSVERVEQGLVGMLRTKRDCAITQDFLSSSLDANKSDSFLLQENPLEPPTEQPPNLCSSYEQILEAIEKPLDHRLILPGTNAHFAPRQDTNHRDWICDLLDDDTEPYSVSMDRSTSPINILQNTDTEPNWISHDNSTSSLNHVLSDVSEPYKLSNYCGASPLNLLNDEEKHMIVEMLSDSTELKDQLQPGNSRSSETNLLPFPSNTNPLDTEGSKESSIDKCSPQQHSQYSKSLGYNKVQNDLTKSYRQHFKISDLPRDCKDYVSDELRPSSSVLPMIRLHEILIKSKITQDRVQAWEKAQGLPRSHSVTMMHTSRSRRQLLEGKILRKWNGAPLLGGGDRPSDKISKKKSRRKRRKTGSSISLQATTDKAVTKKKRARKTIERKIATQKKA